MSERNAQTNREGADAVSTGPAAADTSDTNAPEGEPSLQEHHNPETDEDTASGGSA